MGSPLEGHQSGRASLESAEGERVEPEVTAAEEVTTAEAKEGEEGEGGGAQVEDSLPEEHPATPVAGIVRQYVFSSQKRPTITPG